MLKMKKCITSFDLKMMALITMFIDHLGGMVLRPLIQASFSITAETHINASLSDRLLIWISEHQDVMTNLYWIMRTIGRCAFPIYCFLIVQGFLHTRSVKKYMLRLALFAIGTEMFLDFGSQGVLLNFDDSNVFFTLLAGLAVIAFVAYMEPYCRTWSEKAGKNLIFWLTYIGVVLLALIPICVIVYFLHSDYSIYGVLTIVVMYLFRKYRLLSYALGLMMLIRLNFTSITIFAFVVLIPLALYNGEKGKSAKYFFYAFYPLHIAALAVISDILLML
ncbi:MAG: hypothetical protein IJY37_08780 [Clostridia bacterium]|nr:hypothetical protein [Clostridia bacterium]